MTHLKIIQGNNQSDTEEVDMDIINKLYELASSGDLDAASELKGCLHLQVGERAKMEYLTNMFPNKLFITASNYIIPFEDQNMVTYLNSIGVGSNGVITEADAAAATIVANSANTTVTKFNELKYFTQITQSRGGLSGYDSGYVRFAGWTALEEVDLSNFTSIGHSHGSAWEDTFANCTNLKKVVASDKLTVIGVRAFDDCQNLEEIIGLDGTLTVYGAAFFRNKKLKNSNFANVEILFPISNNGESFSQTELITSLTLSAQNTTIPGYAFYGSKIATLNFPAGLTSIQDSAFKNSDLAVNASVLSNVTSFGDSCLTNTKITGTFTANANLVLLNNYAFLQSRIQAADLSNIGSPSLGRAVFAECTQLTSVILPSSMTKLEDAWFLNCSALTSINLGNITTFESECLRGCTRLQVNMPQNIILNGGHGAFQEDANLQFPAQITVSSVSGNSRIGVSAFRGTSVQEVTIDSSIDTLNTYCFSECASLKKVNGLPNIKYITGYTFYECSSLEGEIDLSNVEQDYLPERFLNVGQNEAYCAGIIAGTKVTSIKLGDLTYLTNSNFQFGYYPAPFRDCSMLHTVDIKSLANIVINANDPTRSPFYTTNVGPGCSSMRNFVLRCTTVPTIEQGTASQINMYLFGGSQVTIYVPDSALNDYKTAWAPIASYIKGLSEYVPITS